MPFVCVSQDDGSRWIFWRITKDNPEIDIRAGDLLTIRADQPGWQDDGLYVVIMDGGVALIDRVKTRTKRGKVRHRISIGGLLCCPETDGTSLFCPFPVEGVYRKALS